jgi:predicted DCC family thiol-disulfide oxidoreductase YuxK
VDSIILYIPKVAYYTKADAVLTITKDLSGLLPTLSMLKILPIFILNPIYDFIAKNRYQWYGKKENCMIPTKETAIKFLPNS